MIYSDDSDNNPDYDIDFEDAMWAEWEEFVAEQCLGEIKNEKSQK